jgi:hypothetical protein
MVVGLVLPEWLSRAPEDRIRRTRASTFNVHQSFAQRYQGPQKDMDVVGHDDPREELIEPPLGHASNQDSADAFSHLCVLQP